MFCTTSPRGKQLVLHDHLSGLCLPTTGARSIIVAAVSFDNVVGSIQADDLASPVRMVAHIGGTRQDVTLMLFGADATDTARQTIILQVSSQAATSDSAINNNVVWLSMKSREAYKKVADWLPQFLDLSFDDAVEIAKATDRAKVPPEIERRCPEFLDIIVPRRIENLLAFRLLCEAAKVVEKENNKRKAKGEKMSNTAEQSGITIHAPVDIGDWLAPFGGSGAEDIAHVAGMIDSGAVKAAEVVLKAANGDGNLSDAITKFLNLSETQNS